MYKGSVAAGNMVNKGTSVSRKERARGSRIQDEVAKGCRDQSRLDLQAMMECWLYPKSNGKPLRVLYGRRDEISLPLERITLTLGFKHFKWL